VTGAYFLVKYFEDIHLNHIREKVKNIDTKQSNKRSNQNTKDKSI